MLSFACLSVCPQLNLCRSMHLVLCRYCSVPCKAILRRFNKTGKHSNLRNSHRFSVSFGGQIVRLTRMLFPCSLLRHLTVCPVDLKEYGILHVGDGQDTAVGIATRYGPYSSWAEPRWRLDFSHPSRQDPPNLLFIRRQAPSLGKAAGA